MAGLQGKLGHPLSLSGIQVHEDRWVLIPGDAKLWKVKLIDEAQDISAGEEKRPVKMKLDTLQSSKCSNVPGKFCSTQMRTPTFLEPLVSHGHLYLTIIRKEK